MDSDSSDAEFYNLLFEDSSESSFTFSDTDETNNISGPPPKKIKVFHPERKLKESVFNFSERKFKTLFRTNKATFWKLMNEIEHLFPIGNTVKN